MVQKNKKKNKQIKKYLIFLFKKTHTLKFKENFFFQKIKKNIINIDFIFKKKIIKMFVNLTMTAGKKMISEKIIYKLFLNFKKYFLKNTQNIFKSKKKINFNNSLYIFILIIKYLKIPFNIKNVRVGGKVYQVPFLVKLQKQIHNSLKLIIKNFLNKYKNKNKYNSKINVKDLFNVLLLQSSLNKYIYDSYKIVYENRAFAHYRWF